LASACLRAEAAESQGERLDRGTYATAPPLARAPSRFCASCHPYRMSRRGLDHGVRAAVTSSRP
jgi:hypothetical protein